MEAIKFGTDGLRGIVNKSITPKVAYDLGCALALFLLQSNDKPKVLVAEDTRKSCDLLRCSFCSGLMSYGVDCICLGEMPTPALAFLTKKKKANAGVMITASHNSYEYNGFKIFNSQGMKIDMLTTLTLERYAQILCKCSLNESENIGTCKLDNLLLEKYVKYLQNEIKENKFSVCFDCANGTTYNILKKLFPNAKYTGIDVYKNKENENCGATNIKNLKKYIKQVKADIGFSFDGDGDRVIVISSNGKVYDGDDILYIFTKYFKERNMLKKNEVVGTIMTNFGIELALKQLGVSLIRQQVGDKFISYEMKKKNLLLGAEQAGHIIVSRGSIIGDGIYACILMLNILNEIDVSLEEYTKDVKKYIQTNISVSVDEDMKDYILDNYELKDYIVQCENDMGYKGRIVVRKSGTESLIRILVEGQEKEYCDKIANKIKEKIVEISK